MASPGELVKVIADVLGVPEPQVIQHDRNLAVAGLRAVGGRGRSAAKMAPLDAANLLIGVAASSMVKETVEVVKDYAFLPPNSGEIQTDHKHRTDVTPKWELSGFPVPALQALPNNHKFRDALACLIQAATDGSLDRAIEALPPQSDPGHNHHIPNLWNIRVVLFGPYPQASITIHSTYFTETHRYADIPTEMSELKKWSEEINVKPFNGDLKQIREFSAKTIVAIGNLLKV